MRENELNYIKGDATNPIGEGKKYIIHICNDIGGWGAGFVLALSKKWKLTEQQYRLWHKNGTYTDQYYSDCKFELGNIQKVEVTEDISVINMIAQHNCWPTKDKNGNAIPPIRYTELGFCLKKVAKLALEENASIHMPKIGAGLAGGRWEIIEKMIKGTLVNKNIDTTVYLF